MMTQDKVALVCTVYTEGDSMRELLDSVANQSRRPDEAIFVDGGSADETQEVIAEYADEYDWIRLIVEDGCNIAEGRNIGVENTDAEIIATTDGGCVLDEEWLENLLENFPEADVSAGVFEPKTDGSRFKEILGILETPNPDDLPAEWNPSSRSEAFTREAWEAVGGYPEDLYTGEDAEFHHALREQGFDFKIAHDAVVYWEMRDSLKGVWKQYKLYGKGDAENNILSGLRYGNYNAIKTALTLGLVTASFTLPLALLEPLYGVPGAVSLFFLLFYKSWALGEKALNPLNLLELMKLNIVMRFGFFLGFLNRKIAGFEFL